MSADRPYIVSDEDNEDANSDLELLDYDSVASEPEVTGVFARILPSTGDRKARSATALQASSILLPDTEIQHYKLSKSCTLRPGDTVELKDPAAHQADTMHSGDFLRIKHIILDLQTDQVRLRGYRLRRTKYLGQIFDWKLNELSMVLHVKENDPRCPFVAGMEDMSIDEVLRLRNCVLTNKSYPFLSFRDEQGCSFPASLTEKEVKQNIFHGGRLACRVVNILFMSKNGKPYGGIVRHLYRKESDALTPTADTIVPVLSLVTPIPIDDDHCTTSSDTHGLSGQGKKRARSPSVEILEAPTKQRLSHPVKEAHYTFGDVFCGAGGASQGAKQAGLHICWGLDNDERAIEAYSLNHPGALPFRQNAHNFPPTGYTSSELRVDILHLSPPCCFFSPAHTIDGPNDQANMEAIFTVGAILKKVKPRVATLEQTFGLATHTQHKANFLMLLFDISQAGYDMRYKIQDLSQHGLVQRRKRLLIIAAKRGTPLPPFPKQSHGSDGSGLKKFNYIHDALIPIQRLASRPSDDPYHQPQLAKIPRSPYSPHTFLKGCITTSGPDSYHYTGVRKFTPRELSLFQGFPYTYKFTGSKCEATKQIGNAFPPIMAAAVYRTIAKTLEAFDKRLITAEDYLSDLDDVLERQGVNMRRTPSFARSMSSAPTRAVSQPSRYLIRDDNARRAVPSYSSPFAREQASRLPQTRRRAASSVLIEDEFADDFRPSVETRPRQASGMGSAINDAIEVSSESEDETDSDNDEDDEDSDSDITVS